MGYIQCYNKEEEKNEVKFQNGGPKNETQENVKKIINLENSYDRLKKENNANIQKIKELEDKITILQNELNQKVLKEQNKNYSQVEIQKMKESNAKMSEEIIFLKAQISSLQKENSELNKKLNETLASENNNFINNNNLANNNNNNNTTKTILFKFENGKKYQAVTFDRKLLRDDVFPLILEQMENDDKLDIEKLTFNYNGQDITQHFLNNDPVRCLNLPANSIIEVNKTNNFLLDKTANLNKNKINKFNYFS